MDWPSRKTVYWFLRLTVSVAIAVILFQIKFDYLEAIFFDLRVHLRPSPRLSDLIEIVMIDSKTVEKLQGIPGYRDHAKILEYLSTAQPKIVAYIRGFAPVRGYEDQYGEDDRRGFFVGSEAEQKQFVEAAQKLSSFVVQTDILERAGETGKLSLAGPLSVLNVLSGPKTVDKNILAKDGVTRRALVSYQGHLLLHPFVAEQMRGFDAKVPLRGVLNIFDSQQVYIDFAKPGSFSTTKFEDLLEGKVSREKFHGKLVIVGDDLGLSARDYVATPFSHEGHMTMAELHANMFETFIRNSAPEQVPRWLDLLFTVLISILTVHVVLTLRPLRGLAILLGTALGFSLFSYLSFWLFGVWVGMAHPFLAIFICYYFFIPYRLIIENRRSWEYYQKHQLLQQVEQLKTNFISMMSHDLKTPLARIQGMTDVILKDSVALSSHQREALDTIRASSSDLLSFINSILNYARIESQGVELHKQGKDINVLLQEVIKRHEFLAGVKHMKIQADLEPLFSISVDPDLIKQVFSNLLENAIKYSPDGTRVMVQSEEAEGCVRVHFIDEGPGIPAEELPHIFMKFFRSKNAKTSPIKGSGLGLYLAKYFVELHKGRIFVTSPPGKGSTFTVELPLGN